MNENFDDFEMEFEEPEFEDQDFDFDENNFSFDIDGKKNNKKKMGARCFHFDGQDRLYKRPKELPALKEKFVRFEYAADFVKSLEFPAIEGESIYAIVSGSFYFGDIMLPISSRSGGGHRLDICTLSMSKENIDMIYQMFEENHISEANIILSDYFYSHERRKDGLFTYLMELLVRPGKWPVKISIASVHTKIIMMQNERYNIVISGSANLRSSANVEQFEMKNSRGLWEFNKTWMDEIHEKFDIVKKPIRSRNLGGIIK